MRQTRFIQKPTVVDPLHTLPVTLIEAGVGLQLLADEDGEKVVDELAL
jgi:hypothetical protein